MSPQNEDKQIELTQGAKVYKEVHHHHHHRLSLNARVVGAPQMISQPVSSIFPRFQLPSGTWWTPGLSIPWGCHSLRKYIGRVKTSEVQRQKAHKRTIRKQTKEWNINKEHTKSRGQWGYTFLYIILLPCLEAKTGFKDVWSVGSDGKPCSTPALLDSHFKYPQEVENRRAKSGVHFPVSLSNVKYIVYINDEILCANWNIEFHTLGSFEVGLK